MKRLLICLLCLLLLSHFVYADIAGEGDSVSVNGVECRNIDFDNSMPAAVSNAINVTWQKDTGTPCNTSAYLLLTLMDGAGIGVSGAELNTQSDEAGFLVDLGGSDLSCGAGTAGKMAVNDADALQYCDGATTPARKTIAFGNDTGQALDINCSSPPCVTSSEIDSTLAGKTFTGTTNISERFDLGGDLTPPQITANQNDYDPSGLSTASILRLSTDATNRHITGLAGGSDGRVILIHNIGGFVFYLDHESTSSTAANRFILDTGFSQIPVSIKSTLGLVYDGTSSRWRVLNKNIGHDLCEEIIPSATTSSEFEFCYNVNVRKVFLISCECYGTCSTVPTIKICKGEDLDGTCGTNMVDATESTTLSCTTGGTDDFTINSPELNNEGVSLIITNTPSGVSFLRVSIGYETP